MMIYIYIVFTADADSTICDWAGLCHRVVGFLAAGYCCSDLQGEMAEPVGTGGNSSDPGVCLVHHGQGRLCHLSLLPLVVCKNQHLVSPG